MIRLIHVNGRTVAALREAHVYAELIRLHQKEGMPYPAVTLNVPGSDLLDLSLQQRRKNKPGRQGKNPCSSLL